MVKSKVHPSDAPAVLHRARSSKWVMVTLENLIAVMRSSNGLNRALLPKEWCVMQSWQL